MNSFDLPEHLADMTQAKWDALTPAQRDKLCDTSKLHAKLKGLEGRKVKVWPKRQSGASTFRVGVSAGWRPCSLAMRAGARGSSDVVSANEIFEHVVVID